MTCSETPIQMTAEFSFEIIEARRKWYNIFQPPKKKKNHCPLIILYSVKIFFRNEGEHLI